MVDWVIWNIYLTHVFLDEQRVEVDSDSDVFDILIESYESEEQERFNLNNISSAHLKLVWFLNIAGNLASYAEEAEMGDFQFLSWDPG